MESQNKYYTPEIEEFHVGFEFEISMTSIGGLDIVDFSKDPIQVDHISKPNNKIWEKTKVFFDTSYGFKNKLIRSIEQLKEILDDGNIRVKYLDREDIESLGFKYYKTHPGTTTLEFEGDKCDITFDSGFSKYWNITITHTEDGDFTYFHGFIKNKSELKRLLKQLGI